MNLTDVVCVFVVYEGTLSITSSSTSDSSVLTVSPETFTIASGAGDQDVTLTWVLDGLTGTTAVTVTLTDDRGNTYTFAPELTITDVGVMDTPSTYVDTYIVDVTVDYLDVSVVLSNIGSGAITVSDLTFSGGLGTTSTFSDVTSAGPVPAMDTYTFQFRLFITDTASADKTGNFILTHNGDSSGSTTTNIPYEIRVQASALEVLPLTVTQSYLYNTAAYDETITITNGGGTTSSIDNIVCSQSWLTPSVSSISSIGVGASATMTVNVDLPSLAGAATYSETCTLTTNDGKEEVVVFTLTIASEVLQGWTISSSAATVNDGQVTFSVPLQATSSTAITIESFSSTGGNLPSALQYTQTVNTLISAGAQQTLTFTLDFSAEADATRGEYSGTLEISHDYGGSGTIVELALEFDLTSPGFSLDVSSISRVLRLDATDSGAQTITVTNDGDEDLTVSVSDPVEAWVSVVDSSVFNTVITAGSTRSVDVQFTALLSSGVTSSDLGVNTASLVLSHNAEKAGQSDTVTLSLDIQQPELQVTVPVTADKTILFGEVISSEEDVTVENLGDWDLSVDNLAADCGSDSWLSVDFTPNTPLTLANGETATLTLGYDVTGLAGGSYSCDVTFDHDAPYAGETHSFTVSLVISSRPLITDPADITTSVRQENTLTSSLLFANAGDLDLVVSDVSVTGDLSALSTTWTTSNTIAASGSDSLEVAFDLVGVGVGVYTGTVDLTHNSDPVTSSSIGYSVTVTAPQLSVDVTDHTQVSVIYIYIYILPSELLCMFISLILGHVSMYVCMYVCICI